jgi:hypothetical protein
MYDELYEALRLAQEHEDLHAKNNPKRDTCRIYYDQDGNIPFAQIGPPWLEQRVEPFIEKPAEVLETLGPWHCVRDGKLILLDFAPQSIVKLVRSSDGHIRVVKGLSSLPLLEHEEYDEIERYQYQLS